MLYRCTRICNIVASISLPPENAKYIAWPISIIIIETLHHLGQDLSLLHAAISTLLQRLVTTVTAWDNAFHCDVIDTAEPGNLFFQDNVLLRIISLKPTRSRGKDFRLFHLSVFMRPSVCYTVNTLTFITDLLRLFFLIVFNHSILYIFPWAMSLLLKWIELNCKAIV